MKIVAFAPAGMTFSRFSEWLSNSSVLVVHDQLGPLAHGHFQLGWLEAVVLDDKRHFHVCSLRGAAGQGEAGGEDGNPGYESLGEHGLFLQRLRDGWG
jgi:hypothetical protein